MDLAASIVLFAAASLIAVAAFYLHRMDRMPSRSQKLVLGVKLPKLGESGSITEVQMHELFGMGVITPHHTWLSAEQAALLLESGAYVEAIWSRLMGISRELPNEARKAGLKILLTHSSYLQEARMWVKHESFDTDPPVDSCARHLTAILGQWVSVSPEPEARQNPVSA